MERNVHTGNIVADPLLIILEIEFIDIILLLFFILRLLLLCQVLLSNLFGHFAYVRVFHAFYEAFRFSAVAHCIYWIRNGPFSSLQSFGWLANWVLLLDLTQIELTNSLITSSTIRRFIQRDRINNLPAKSLLLLIK